MKRKVKGVWVEEVGCEEKIRGIEQKVMAPEWSEKGRIRGSDPKIRTLT